MINKTHKGANNMDSIVIKTLYGIILTLASMLSILISVIIWPVSPVLAVLFSFMVFFAGGFAVIMD